MFRHMFRLAILVLTIITIPATASGNDLDKTYYIVYRQGIMVITRIFFNREECLAFQAMLDEENTDNNGCQPGKVIGDMLM